MVGTPTASVEAIPVADSVAVPESVGTPTASPEAIPVGLSVPVPGLVSTTHAPPATTTLAACVSASQTGNGKPPITTCLATDQLNTGLGSTKKVG